MGKYSKSRCKYYISTIVRSYYLFVDEAKNETVDLSRRGLKKIEKAPAEESKTIINLILDQNELQRLDNIDTYNRVENVRRLIFYVHYQNIFNFQSRILKFYVKITFNVLMFSEEIILVMHDNLLYT